MEGCVIPLPANKQPCGNIENVQLRQIRRQIIARDWHYSLQGRIAYTRHGSVSGRTQYALAGAV